MFPKAVRKKVSVLKNRKWFVATYAPKKPDAEKPPIVLIHGRTSDHFDTWKNQIQHFTQKGYKVIAYDLDGHGRSSGNGRLSVSQHADGLRDLLKKLRIEQAVVIGHSDGGVIAQQFAYDHPEYVLGVGLVNSYVALTPEMKSTIRNIMAVYLQESRRWNHVSYPETRNRLLELAEHAGFPLPRLSRTYNPLMLFKMKPYFEMLRHHSDVFNEASAPTVPPIFPLTILNAERDFFLSRQPEIDFAKRYANRGAAPVMIDADTHSLQMDRPIETNRHLDGLLRQVRTVKKLETMKAEHTSKPGLLARLSSRFWPN